MVTSRLRTVPFVALFPGFFIYQWAAINGWIPFVMGGFVNEISVLLIGAFAMALFIATMRGKRSPVNWNEIDLCFLLFMAWFAVVGLVNASLGTAPGVTRSHLAAWLQMLACYLVTRNMAIARSQIFLLWLTGLFAFLVLTAGLVDPAGFVLMVTGTDETQSATYQGLARAFLITAVFGLVGVTQMSWRWIGYTIVICVVFMLGARSEIIGTLILFFVFEISITPRKLRLISWLTVATVISFGFIFFYLDALSELFPSSRFIALLIAGSDDGSVIERSYYQALSWQATLDSPLLGDYGHYERAASAGAYAHNWLSVWVDLGLIGLMLFIFLHLIAALTVVQILRTSSGIADKLIYRYASLALGFLVMIAVFAIFAKSFTDTGLAITLGLIASLHTMNPMKSRMS